MWASRCFIGRRRFEALAEDLEVGVVGVDEHTAVCFDFRNGTVEAAGVGKVTLQGQGQLLLSSGDSAPLDDVRDLLGASDPVPNPPPSPGRVGFAQALAAGDLEGAVEALLTQLEAVAEESDARAAVERGIVELAELARRGLGDPRERVAGFVEALLEWRSELRKEGRWEEADRIRARLAELGVDVRDRPEGPEWRLV